MPPIFEKCEWCGRDLYPNQLAHSEHHGGKVCGDCRADQGPTHGESQLAKREAAKKKAWNCGEGWDP